MIELNGLLNYDNQQKEIILNYPEEKGIYKDGYYFIMTNPYIVEKYINDMFFNIKGFKMNLGVVYHYELEKDVLVKIYITLDNEKEANRFIRKNKIKNLIEDGN